jgi:HD-GYP domain-containing protein (c-di-GMP phosphodiesterase class II)
VLKKTSLDFLILLTAVSAGLFAVLALLVYPSAFSYQPGLMTLLAYLPIALAAGFFGLRGVVGVALLASLIVGVFNVQQGRVVVSPFWWQTSSLYVLFALTSGSLIQVVRWRKVQEPEKQEVVTPQKLDSSLLKGLVSALKLRDRAAQSHSEWVAQNAFVVGRHLGSSIAELENLYWAALLHDLGKIAISETILLKPATLSESEYAEVKRHPENGAKLLKSLSEDFAGLAESIRAHHERWDGGGYPDGLVGEAIPKSSRIIAVVDVFDALTSVRPYRSPLPAGHALQYLEHEAGRHFDPEVVKTFVTCFERGEIRYMQSETTNRRAKTPALDELVKETVQRKN